MTLSHVFRSAFRDVLRDNQFSSIGIVLISILSSLERLILAILQKLRPLDSDVTRQTVLKNKSVLDQTTSGSYITSKEHQDREISQSVAPTISKTRSKTPSNPTASSNLKLDSKTKPLTSRSKTGKKKDSSLLDELFDGMV